ncbi:MAG TPA: S9 family peptidase [Caulobacteraceae bacterium]|nr:S9 family peptidase [Caulobacteraceae bacterium]
MRAAPPPLEAYGNLPGVAFMTLSPAGDRYAFVRMVAAARQLVIVPVASGKATVLGFPPDVKLRDVSWADDNHVLVTTSGTTHTAGIYTVDNFETEQVLVVPLNGKPSFVVFNGHNDVAPMVTERYGNASIDGHSYGYFGAITLDRAMNNNPVLDHSYSDLYRVDLDTGAMLRVAKGGVNIDVGQWLVGPEGKILAQSSYFARTGAWEINTSSGAVILAGHSLTDGPALTGFGLTMDTVLVRTPGAPNSTYRLASISGGAEQAVADGERMVEPLFDRRTRIWIGEVLGGDAPRVVLFAPERQARLDAAHRAFAKYHVQLVSYDDKFDRFVVYTDSGDDSGTYWLVDSDKHSVESIGQAYPQVKEPDVGPVRMVDWKASDGLELHGVLTLPQGRAERGLPVVVLPHGGPQARDTLGFDWWAQAFAARGYAVFQPNFRGSAGYGQAFVDAGHGQWGRKMQTDISDGLAALAAQGIVDPKRACIVGASYGGYAALAGVTVQHGLYRCAVSDAGVADLHRMLKYEDARSGYDASSVALRYWKQFMGAASEADPSLDAISPVQLADRADAPILLIHGKDDTVVPIEQSQQMQAALKRAGKPVEMVIMPGEDHWLSRPETRLGMLTAAVAFVQKYNPAD